MKILDLTNLENSDIKYKVSKFPDGQQAITLDLENTNFDSEAQSVTIKSRLNSFLDLELIVCANQALLELGVKHHSFRLKDIDLYTPFFIGGRSDRKFLNGQSNYLKTVIAPIINLQKFSRVTILDPHSDVLEACVDNFQKITNVNFAKESIDDISTNLLASTLNGFKSSNFVSGKLADDIVLISPDAGALKKIYDVATAVDCSDIIVANKLRDLKTGKIIRTEVPGIDQEPGCKTFVIVDDICDGGRTFVEIAKAIRDVRAKAIYNDKIYLVVTHGIFTAGFEELEKWFTGVYTTNSVKEIENDLVKQVNVF